MLNLILVFHRDPCNAEGFWVFSALQLMLFVLFSTNEKENSISVLSETV
jgi:hypothetical protein